MTTTQTMSETERATVARGRRTLVGIAALLFVPLVLSFWLY